MPKELTPEQLERRRAAKLRDYYKNKEKRIATSRAWKERNKDKTREQDRKRHALESPAEKAASLAKLKQWAKDHPDVVREADKRTKKKNRATRLEYERRYRASRAKPRLPRLTTEERKIRQLAYKRANYAKNKVYTDRWRAANRERVKAKAAAWREANPERWVELRMAAHHKRRAMKKGCGGSHTIADWRRILKDHGHRCAYCGVKQSSTVKLTRDHYAPLTKGGDNSARNIVPACLSCNVKKRDSDPLDFARTIGRLV